MPEFDFTTFPALTTNRLILHQSVPSDAPDLFAYLSDAELLKYEVFGPLKEVSEAVFAIEANRQRFVSKEGITWNIVLKSEKRGIGGIGFLFDNQAYYKADIWYNLARPYWRRGIATEAGRAVLQFGFETLHLHRINVDTRMDNIASVGLMAKLGFHHEGVRRECVLNQDGTYQNWGLFGMLSEEYRYGSQNTV